MSEPTLSPAALASIARRDRARRRVRRLTAAVGASGLAATAVLTVLSAGDTATVSASTTTATGSSTTSSSSPAPTTGATSSSQSSSSASGASGSSGQSSSSSAANSVLGHRHDHFGGIVTKVTSRPAAATFPALGTTVTVATTDPARLVQAVEIVDNAVRSLDQAASRFRDDSELMRLQNSGGRAVGVSDELFVALDEALRAASATGGLLDPTVGEALEVCGYDRDFASVVSDGAALTVRLGRVPGYRAIRLDRLRRSVAVPPGVRLDLGATAKAGCADRAAAAAGSATGAGVLVNLGGDIAVAGSPPCDGWPVRVADRHDSGPADPGVTVAITTGGLATSGTAARRWQRGGRQFHHVIDPATGAPAAPYWRTVTVAADSCLSANVASTASVILGPAAPAWLAERGLHARLVTEDGAVVGTGDWPAAALKPHQSDPSETVPC